MLDITGQIASELTLARSGAVAAPPAPNLPVRFVAPRRPDRPAPSPGQIAPTPRPRPRRNLARLNIFADAFAEECPATDRAAQDPRVAAGRERARHLLTQAARALPPDQANFWHPLADSTQGCEDRAPGLAAVSTRHCGNDHPDLPRPLSGSLARVRHALYAPQDAAPTPAMPASRPMRLAATAMNATLIIVAFPVGAVLATHSVLRGANLRLTAQAMAMVAAVTGMLQLGLGHAL